MESMLQGPSLNQKENHKNEDFIFENGSFDFPFKQNFLSRNICNSKSFENLKDCMCEPDYISKSTSSLDDKNKQKNMNAEVNSSFTPDQEISVETLMETVDLSDLTFSSDDFMLDDCTCFEQASQLVDPTLKDSESTPFSFNNSDSVQLFRYSLTENTEDSLLNFVKYSDNLFNKNSEKYKMIYGDDDFEKNEQVYHVLELLDSKINVNNESKSLNKGSVQYENKKTAKKKGKKNLANVPIKKGRRYLPNFKQKVLEYTKNHTFKDTALHFKINCNTITEWSRDSKRLSLQNNNISMPGSDCNNYKTDIDGTPESKTEIILYNDVMSFETDFNEPSTNDVENDLPPVDMKPDERFIKWIETKRLQRKQLSGQEVFHMAKYCQKKCPPNQEKSWFVIYLKRFNKALMNSVTSAEAEKYIKYPINFKLEVALYARIFSKNSAARVFNVSRKRIFDWFNCLNPLKDSFAVHGKNETGDNEETVEAAQKLDFNAKKDKIKNKIYLELHHWYQKRFMSGARPTSYEIKEKAREIFSANGITSIKFSDGWLQKFCQRMNIKLRHSEDDRLLLWVLTQLDNNVSLSHQDITEKSSSLIGKKKFKGSKGWTLRFLKRHRDLLQRSPTVEDPLPQIVQDKLNCFWNGFRHCVVSLQIKPGSIGCLDELPLSFSYPEDGKSGPPLLRKTGFENCQGIVLLCSLASGRVLPPAIVFTGNGPKQLFSDRDTEILVLYQEKGFVTVDILEAWFHDIWLSCVPTASALVVDSFEPHCAIQFRQMLAREKCLLHVIPEGCSSKFQPLNVETIPSFKETMKKQWKEFSSSLNSELMRRYRCPDQNTVLGWVQIAYDKIKRNPVSIINSFKTTGLLQ